MIQERELQPIPGSQKGKSLPTGKMLRILGIDPGLASTGWGVIDFFQNRYRLVSYGVIETPSEDERGVRLSAIYTRMVSIIETFKPVEAGMESLFFAKNVTSAMGVSEAKGVVTLCLAQNCIKLGEYSPIIIKQSVTGTTKADKKLVQEYIRLLLGLETVPKPDHAADALAAAITHAHHKELIPLEQK